MSEHWKYEPDNVVWECEGAPCRIVRHPNMKHLCGYVGVAEGHSWHGKDYDSINPHSDVHGGLTYAANHAPNETPDGYWWVGFDCAHVGDLVPGISASAGEVYRSVEFVRAECESLARQAGVAA